MANESTYSTLTEIIDSEWISRTVEQSIRENAVMLALTKVVDIGAMSTRTVAFPISPTLTASSKAADNTATSNTAFDTTDITASVAEYSVMCTLTDMASQSSVIDGGALIAEEMGRALTDAYETAACALLSGFSNTVGTTTADITAAIMLEALKDHRATAKGFAGDSVYVLHPIQVYDLQVQALSSPTNGLSPAFQRADVIDLFGANPGEGVLKSLAGSFAGVPIFSHSSVPLANSSADRAGALFARNAALGTIVKWMPRIETGRDIANGLNATKYLGTLAFAVLEIRDALGISIITDA